MTPITRTAPHAPLHVRAGQTHVHVADFEGPFDLLLQLAAEHKVDIFDIDVAVLTTAFLRHLETLDELDLQAATHFIVVAATMIELKSRRLIPGEDDDLSEELAQARDLLYARLIEFKAFKDVSEDLAALMRAWENRHPRTAQMPSELRRIQPDVELSADPVDLARLAAAAIHDHGKRKQATVSLTHLRQSGMRTREAVIALLEWIPLVGDAAIFARATRRRPITERVVMFLAMLELHKVGAIVARQDADGTTHFTRRTREIDAVMVQADGARPGTKVPVIPAPDGPPARDESTPRPLRAVS